MGNENPVGAAARHSISIVIPNWNSGEVLRRCVDSLLAQNYPKLQLIMMDAGSTDVSRDIIEEYRERFDVVISEKDNGQADGLNRGFRHATGEIRGWLCADDELLPGALHHVDRIFSEHPETDVVIGRCERVFADGNRYVTPVDTEVSRNIIVKNTVEQPSTFWREYLHRKVGDLDNSYRLGFDWDLWIRFRNAGARFFTTEEVLSRYYFTEDNKTSKAGHLFAEESFRIVRTYGPFNGRLALLFRFFYRTFDLKGCMDKPPTSSHPRYWVFLALWRLANAVVGKRYMSLYNWHFGSCQVRGIKWY